MSNSIKIFEDKTVDGDSAEFTINNPNSKGYADTEFSAYLEFYAGAGGLDGGTLQLKKKSLDGTFRILEIETNDINSNFPADALTLLVRPVNYKNEVGENNENETAIFKLTLTGTSSSANVFVDGVNIKFVEV